MFREGEEEMRTLLEQIIDSNFNDWQLKERMTGFLVKKKKRGRGTSRCLQALAQALAYSDVA